jgi:hypothetical protein
MIDKNRPILFIQLLTFSEVRISLVADYRMQAIFHILEIKYSISNRSWSNYVIVMTRSKSYNFKRQIKDVDFG